MKKWKKQRKELGKTLRECNDHLRPLEQAFDDKMIEYEKKEQDKFDKKHNKVLTTRDDTLKARSKASAQIRGYLGLRASCVRHRLASPRNLALCVEPSEAGVTVASIMGKRRRNEECHL